MPETVDIALTDPDDLSPNDLAKIDRLIGLTEDQFDAQMNQYVSHPNEADQLIFRHPDVVELSYDSLNRLIGKARRIHMKLRPGPRRTEVAEQMALYQAERKVIKPYYNIALTQKAAHSVKTRTARIVTDVFRAELASRIKYTENCIKNGMSDAEARTAVKTWWAERQSTKTM